MHFLVEEGLEGKGGAAEASEGQRKLLVLRAPDLHLGLPHPVKGATREDPWTAGIPAGAVRIKIQNPVHLGSAGGAAFPGDLSLPHPSPIPIKSQERCQLEARRLRPLCM